MGNLKEQHQMKISDVSRYALSVCVTAILLAGCGGLQSPSTGNAVPVPALGSNGFTHGVSNDAAHPGRLFVADDTASKVLIYRAGVQNPAPIGTISDGVSSPQSLAVDQHGTLYVQNRKPDTITEYPEGQKTVSKTLTERALASAVTVGSDGTVYALRGCKHYPCYKKIYEFKNGSTKPKLTFSVPPGSNGLTVDSHDNLLVAWSACGFPTCNYGVSEFKLGSKTPFQIVAVAVCTCSLAVDAQDNWLIGNGTSIAIYKPGGHKPFRTIQTKNVSGSEFAVDSDDKYLYVVGGAPDVYVYDYATGKLAWTITKGLSSASGVTVRPAVRL
jgi:hypothetical protein